MSRSSPNLSLKLPLLLLAASVGGCNDYTTGQDREPDGPLQVLRLTLFDASSRDAPVFTDTSVPDCSLAENQDTATCKSDINRDKFSPRRSPPTPDSGREVRVVFNKPPLLLDGRDLETVTEKDGQPVYTLSDPAAAQLSCADCTGAPPTKLSLILTGSNTTSDPTYPGTHPANIPYGPALLLEVAPDAAHPFAALEPETSYSVRVKAGLSGRNLQGVQVSAQQQASLLTVTTERFQVLRVGIGDSAADSWVHGKADSAGPASYMVKDLANDGAIRIVLSAPIDEGALKMTTATATVGGMNVPVKLGLSQLVTKDGKSSCDPGKARALYVFPAGGTWGGSGVVSLTVKGAEVRDLSQAAMHPTGMGRHALRGDLSISATLSGMVADDKYKGVTAAKVRAAADCPK